MASVTRRLRKHLRWRTQNPDRVLALDEGLRLAERLARAARAVNADPMQYLEYLHRMRRGYDPAHDGQSSLMLLVDQIADFERRQQVKAEANGAHS